MPQMNLGELIRQHRSRSGLKQKELAEKIGYNHTVISRIERGETFPAQEFIDHLIDVLELLPADAQALRLIYEEERLQRRNQPPVTSATTRTRTPQLHDWGEAPDVGTFYGRQGELVGLRHWAVAERCRLIGIFGMGGIGKTTLATTLAQSITAEFDRVLWRSLRNAPPIEDVLRESIAFCSDQQAQFVPGNTDRNISMLLEICTARRCLLILDNLEAILRSGDHAGQYRDGYGSYGQLIHRIGETQHASCLILTSREKPSGVALLEDGKRLVRSFVLGGLGASEGRALLADKGVADPGERWADVVAAYAGNPLALRLVAETISAIFGGDTARFLAHGAVAIGDIRDLLDQQFGRLSLVEQDLMYWLAIMREPIAPEQLQELIVGSLARRTLLEALQSLRRRSLIEQSGAGFTLQNVVMEYMTDRLIDEAFAELVGGIPARMISHPLMMAHTREYIRESQVRVILDPLIERLRAALSDQAINRHIRALLDTLRRDYGRQPGYAGGSALNLLVRLHGELRGYDFSELDIRQAHLRGVEARDLSFAHANLSHSAFTETFGNVYAVAVSPDGTCVAIGTQQGEIRLYRIADGSLVGICQGHANLVWTLDFSPDGATLASGSYDHTIRLWDVRTCRCQSVLREHTEIVRSVTFSSDGRMLVSAAEDQTVRLWDVASMTCSEVLLGLIWWSAAAISPDGAIIACASYDRNIHLWSVAERRWIRTLSGHPSVIWALAFSPDGSLLASCGDDQTARLWDHANGTCRAILHGHVDAISDLAFTSDGQILATGSDDHSIRLWEVATGQCLKVLQGHTDWVPGVAFSADGALLVSGSRDQTTRLWNVSNGQCLTVIQGHQNLIWSVAFHPDGDLLATGYFDRTVRIWSLAEGRCIRVLRGHTNQVRSVAFSPDGRVLASAGSDGTIRLWDARSGRSVGLLRGHTHTLCWATFSPDGRTLATCGRDYSLHLWDVATGQQIRRIQAALMTSDDTTIDFSPDGRVLAQCALDGCVWLWDVSSGERIKILASHDGTPTTVVFSPNGALLASGASDYQVWLWDAASGECLHMFRDLTDWPLCLAFSPDSHLLACSSADRTVRIWDVDSKVCVATLTGHTDWVRSVAFSPDGRVIASAGADATIRLWDAQSHACIKTLRLDPPYAGLDITAATGLAEAQRQSLRALGAHDSEQSARLERDYTV